MEDKKIISLVNKIGITEALKLVSEDDIKRALGSSKDKGSYQYMRKSSKFNGHTPYKRKSSRYT
jgi:hypothetical protein